MDRAGSDRYEKFYRYLPNETINHVRKFMEASYVTRELDLLLTDYKLSAFNQSIASQKARKISNNNPSLVSTVINTAYNLEIIAEEMDVELAELLQWNPEINQELSATGSANLFLPVDKMPDFILLKNTIVTRSIQTDIDHD